MIYYEKYQAAGNDFIICSNIDGKLKDLGKLAQNICDRHFGIGADGLIILEKAGAADVRMTIYNSDGSEAPMCGNGIRAFAKYIYEHQIVTRNTFAIETKAGIMKVELITNKNVVDEIKVNLSKPKLCEDVNLLEDIVIENWLFRGSVLKIGPWHTVILIDKIDNVDILKYGPKIQNYHVVQTNVNFVEVIDRNTIKVITWEKGAGLTLACGTGAAASVIISSRLRRTEQKVKVIMPGGELKVEIEEDVFLIGGAKKICVGLYLF